jgi:hypothetical protein
MTILDRYGWRGRRAAAKSRRSCIVERAPPAACGRSSKQRPSSSMAVFPFAWKIRTTDRHTGSLLVMVMPPRTSDCHPRLNSSPSAVFDWIRWVCESGEVQTSDPAAYARDASVRNQIKRGVVATAVQPPRSTRYLRPGRPLRHPDRQWNQPGRVGRSPDGPQLGRR